MGHKQGKNVCQPGRRPDASSVHLRCFCGRRRNSMEKGEKINTSIQQSKAGAFEPLMSDVGSKDIQ
jgi:hypothetical protein